MKLRVIWFGRPGGSPFEAEVADYLRRVDRRWSAEDMPARPARGGRAEDPRRVLTAEAEIVRRLVPAGFRLVALDRRGRGLSSEELATWLGGREGEGVEGVALVIGSDLGLDPELIASADLRLSLGAVTLPHLIARLVMWEQLFRATQILSGGGYHRTGLGRCGME